MNQNEEAKKRLLDSMPVSPSTFAKKLAVWQERNASTLSALMGSPGEAARLWAVVQNELRLKPDLLSCDLQSFIACLVMSAQMRLFPGAAMQECAFVVYNSRVKERGKPDRWIKVCTWQPMYRGLIKLGVMSRQVRKVDVHEVYEADHFDYEFGLRPNLEHKPFKGPREDKGEITHFYSTYYLPGERIPEFEVMPRHDVDQVKARSKAVKDDKATPWTESELTYIEMGKKTVIKRGFKTIPHSPELAYAINLDDQTERGKLQRVALDVDSLVGSDGGFALEPGADVDAVEETEPEAPETPELPAPQERIEVQLPQREDLGEALEVLKGGREVATVRTIGRPEEDIEVPAGPHTMGSPEEDETPHALERPKQSAFAEFERIKARAAAEREAAARKK